MDDEQNEIDIVQTSTDELQPEKQQTKMNLSTESIEHKCKLRRKKSFSLGNLNNIDNNDSDAYFDDDNVEMDNEQYGSVE
ncbi:hypothetical protein BLA29_014656, partial [Euroglyphus maynei]